MTPPPQPGRGGEGGQAGQPNTSRGGISVPGPGPTTLFPLVNSAKTPNSGQLKKEKLLPDWGKSKKETLLTDWEELKKKLSFQSWENFTGTLFLDGENLKGTL